MAARATVKAAVLPHLTSQWRTFTTSLAFWVSQVLWKQAGVGVSLLLLAVWLLDPCPPHPNSELTRRQRLIKNIFHTRRKNDEDGSFEQSTFL